MQAAAHVQLNERVVKVKDYLITLTYWLGLPLTILARSLVISTSASAILGWDREPSSEINVRFVRNLNAFPLVA